MRGGYREAGYATVSLVDADGERLHSVRMGRMPESHKATLKTMVAAEVEAVLAKRPDLTLVKLADGTKDNWTFLTRALPEGVELISNVQFRSHTRTPALSHRLTKLIVRGSPNRENKEGDRETLRTEIARLEVQRDAGETTEDDRGRPNGDRHVRCC